MAAYAAVAWELRVSCGRRARGCSVRAAGPRCAAGQPAICQCHVYMCISIHMSLGRQAARRATCPTVASLAPWCVALVIMMSQPGLGPRHGPRLYTGPSPERAADQKGKYVRKRWSPRFAYCAQHRAWSLLGVTAKLHLGGRLRSQRPPARVLRSTVRTAGVLVDCLRRKPESEGRIDCQQWLIDCLIGWLFD
jgi:hypothetical protein